jgi:hypothetical protein
VAPAAVAAGRTQLAPAAERTQVAPAAVAAGRTQLAPAAERTQVASAAVAAERAQLASAAVASERTQPASAAVASERTQLASAAVAAERTQLASTTPNATYGSNKPTEHAIGVTTTAVTADNAMAGALAKPMAADTITRAQTELASAAQTVKGTNNSSAVNNLSAVQDKSLSTGNKVATDKSVTVLAAANDPVLSAANASSAIGIGPALKLAMASAAPVEKAATAQIAPTQIAAADKIPTAITQLSNAAFHGDRLATTPTALPAQLSDRVSLLLAEKEQASQNNLVLGNRQSALPADRIAATLGGQSNSSAGFTADAAQLAERARMTASQLNPTDRQLTVTFATPGKAMSFAPDRTVGAVDDRAATLIPINASNLAPDRTVGAVDNRAATAAASGTAHTSIIDVRGIRPAVTAGERTPGQVSATDRGQQTNANERAIKAVDMGGDRGAHAPHHIAGHAPSGRDLIPHGTRNSALTDKAQLQIGLTCDKVLNMGNKLVALKPLHQISENDKRYLTGIELALGLVALTAVARARATEGRESAEEDESPAEGSDGELSTAQISDDYDANVIQRPKHMVQPGETLTTIAEEYYNDARLAWLILSLNKGKVSETWKGDICYVEVNGRQELELPVGEDIATFYKVSAGKYNEKRLVSSVRQSHMDQELVTLAFDNVVGRRLQSASS